MTKEELEKEAEEYAEKHAFRVPYDGSNKFYDDVDFKASKEGYLASAEPREKRIAELTDELILTNNECKDMRKELKQRIRENQKLCEQIEKMRQCGNCGNGTIGNCEYCKRKPNQTCTDTSDYWRLKEIKEK